MFQQSYDPKHKVQPELQQGELDSSILIRIALSKSRPKFSGESKK